MACGSLMGSQVGLFYGGNFKDEPKYTLITQPGGTEYQICEKATGGKLKEIIVVVKSKELAEQIFNKIFNPGH